MPAKTTKRPARAKATKARSTAASARGAQATKRPRSTAGKGTRSATRSAKNPRTTTGKVVKRRASSAGETTSTAAKVAPPTPSPSVPAPIALTPTAPARTAPAYSAPAPAIATPALAADELAEDVPRVHGSITDASGERGPSAFARFKHGVGSLFARMTGRAPKLGNDPGDVALTDQTMEITTEDIILSSNAPPPLPSRSKPAPGTDED
jgi:hypothetical protein